MASETCEYPDCTELAVVRFWDDEGHERYVCHHHVGDDFSEEHLAFEAFRSAVLPYLFAHMTCEECSAQDVERIKELIDD